MPSELSLGNILACAAASVVLGIISALFYMFRNSYTKSFVVTLTLLPLTVQLVIMLVNGNLGAGVAVAGAFSLVRFRSAPGSARDIGSIFLAMGIGLATGMGYIGAAAVFVALTGLLTLIFYLSPFGEARGGEKELKVTIPENLDYTEIFDDLFRKYTNKWELLKVKTTNMGSLYELHYRVSISSLKNEKKLIDQIRCRNGNLNIVCGRVISPREEL
ncbi:MAG: DUF4956 domain-containing protein [Oscillospiraceae bacterium]|nr:DUF4956 domain-containing protein [Oscillospiraceae bacterium]